MKRTRQSRRRLLQATGGVAATALVAGCGGPDEEAEDPETGDEDGGIDGGDDEDGGLDGGDDEPESEEGTGNGQDEDE